MLAHAIFFGFNLTFQIMSLKKKKIHFLFFNMYKEVVSLAKLFHLSLSKSYEIIMWWMELGSLKFTTQPSRHLHLAKHLFHV